MVDARTIIHDALELTGAGMGVEREFLNIQERLSPFFPSVDRHAKGD